MPIVRLIGFGAGRREGGLEGFSEQPSGECRVARMTLARKTQKSREATAPLLDTRRFTQSICRANLPQIGVAECLIWGNFHEKPRLRGFGLGKISQCKAVLL